MKKYLSIFSYFEVVKWIVSHHYTLPQLSYAFLCLLFQLFVLLHNYRSKFSQGKKTTPETLP